MTNLSGFEYNNIALKTNSDFVNLTSLWEMCGCPENQKPAQWARLPETERLISQTLIEQGFQNEGKSHIIKTRRGKGGGTWAHWKLALDYAGYLSVELKSLYYDWVRERIEENSNPELAYDRGRNRAADGWKKQGKSDKWIQQRIQGKEQRIKFTDTLKEHGVNKPHEYAVCTNEIYKPLLGGTAKEIKQQRAITNLRDGMTNVELMAVGLAEAIAEEEIQSNNHRGFKTCRVACNDAGSKVKKVFES